MAASRAQTGHVFMVQGLKADRQTDTACPLTQLAPSSLPVRRSATSTVSGAQVDFRGWTGLQKQNPPIMRSQQHSVCPRGSGSCQDGSRPPSRIPDLWDMKWRVARPSPFLLPEKTHPQWLFSGTLATDKYCPGQERSSAPAGSSDEKLHPPETRSGDFSLSH